MPDSTDQFWTARFHRTGSEASSLRVLWSWSGSGDWVAADQPRLAFAGLPALYKLYVVQPLSRPDEALDQGASHAFLQRMLPELHRCLGSSEPSHAMARLAGVP